MRRNRCRVTSYSPEVKKLGLTFRALWERFKLSSPVAKKSKAR
jgi:hypothetical protein